VQRKSQQDRHHWDFSRKCKTSVKEFASQIAVQDWILQSCAHQRRLHNVTKIQMKQLIA